MPRTKHPKQIDLFPAAKQEPPVYFSPTSPEGEILGQTAAAVSEANWEVGQCAAVWTKRFARGRGDAEFGELVGLSAAQVEVRRRVWETFGDVRQNYGHLGWSHFKAALEWDDAHDCLQWAQDIRATVAEMKAWRRAQRGEDLS